MAMKFLSLCGLIIFGWTILNAQDVTASETSGVTDSKLSANNPDAQNALPAVMNPTQIRKLRDVAYVAKGEPKPAIDVPSAETIDFNFDNADLEEMVRRYTEKMKLNVVFPQAGLKEKITFKPPHKLTLDEARRYLFMFLDYAGYSVLPGPGQSFVVVTQSNKAQRSQLPLFVVGLGSKVSYKDLPDSDEMIRAVYYLTTLKVEGTQDNAVLKLLNELLSSPDNAFFDTMLNGIIISDKARIVKSALHLLSDLDSTEPKYIITTIQLFNASANSVAELINTKILTSRGQVGGFGQDDKQNVASGSYFSTSIRVVADQRRNLLIIMGKEAPVNRLKEFVRESLDAPLESGKSIFHVYDLKYLDAETFAGTLAEVVKSTGIADQATADRSGGATRFFEGVSIKAETYQAAQAAKGGMSDQFSYGSGGGTVYRGGNRLLIAAQPSDWLQIKKLIDTLDIPQRQVIMEVLIADYRHSVDKDLGTHIRSPHAIVPNSGGGAIQTVHDATQVVMAPKNCSGCSGCANLCPNPPPQYNIYGDLLRVIGGSENPNATLLSTGYNGYSVISLDDNSGLVNDNGNKGVWGLITMLDQYGKLKILQHPYLISLNNTTASVSSNEIRRGQGDVPSSTGGAINVNIVDVSASLSVAITPRIASLDRINLDIFIDISNYTSTNPSNYDRNKRTIRTNVNMAGRNQILVLGGLTRFDEQDTISETPLLSKIPLIGWLFKGKSKIRTEVELGVFIKPTVIEPKIREIANKFTKTKIQDGAQGLFDEANDPVDKRDPIIRWFFKSDKTDKQVISDFLQETNAMQETEEKMSETKQSVSQPIKK